MRIGFIGLGNIGAPMASHVAASDHDLAVYDTRPERMEPLVAAGARAATDAADAAAGAELVSVVVLDDAQVLDVTTGRDGVIAAMTAGSVLAIHSTVTRECLREVDGVATKHGVLLLDAGISGGAPGAKAGTLLVIAGGPEATIDAARPGLAPWSREIVRVGGIGAGMAAKIARNYVQYACWAAIHDGQALAQAAGVDLATFEHIVVSTHAVDGTTATLQRRDATLRSADELGGHGPALAQHAALGLKDLAVAEALAAEVGVDLPGLPGARRGFPGSLGLRLDDT